MIPHITSRLLYFPMLCILLSCYCLFCIEIVDKLWITGPESIHGCKDRSVFGCVRSSSGLRITEVHFAFSTPPKHVMLTIVSASSSSSVTGQSASSTFDQE